MAWVNETRDINFILEQLDNTLDTVWANCAFIRENFYEVTDLMPNICEIENSIKGFKNYTKTYKMAIDTVRDNNRELELAVKGLSERLEGTEKALESMTKDIASRLDTMDTIIKFVDEHKKPIAVAHRMRTVSATSLHGAGHPRYINSIDDTALVSDYKADMLLKDLAAKYGLTIAGVRNRLKNLGVYEPVYKSKNQQ